MATRGWSPARGASSSSPRNRVFSTAWKGDWAMMRSLPQLIGVARFQRIVAKRRHAEERAGTVLEIARPTEMRAAQQDDGDAAVTLGCRFLRQQQFRRGQPLHLADAPVLHAGADQFAPRGVGTVGGKLPVGVG